MTTFDTPRVATRSHLPLGASLLAIAAGTIWSLGVPSARSAGHSDTWQYMIWRSIGIIVVMEVIGRVRHGRSFLPIAFGSGRVMIMACVTLLIASICYVYAVKNTSAANAAFLASITPLIAAVLGRFILHERLTRVTLFALAVAIAGLLVTVAGDLGRGSMKGNIAACFSSVGFAGYTVCLRTNKKTDWSAALPGYALMMIVLCGAVTLANGNTFVPPRADVGYALLHGAVFIVVGTIIYNHAAKSVPAVAMTVFAQTETVFAPLWVFLKFSERPKPQTLIGGAIILTAVLGQALLNGRNSPSAIAAPPVMPS
jgi:drug/metabolite transporter, DME family